MFLDAVCYCDVGISDGLRIGVVDGGCVDMEDTNIGDGGVSDLDVAVCRVSGGVQCKVQERREGVVIRIHQLTT